MLHGAATSFGLERILSTGSICKEVIHNYKLQFLQIKFKPSIVHLC